MSTHRPRVRLQLCGESWFAVLLMAALCVGAGGCGRSGGPVSQAEGIEGGREERRITVPPASASRLPVYELVLPAGGLAALDRGDFSNATQPATFRAGGRDYGGARVRVRGQWSRGWPKKSLKVLFADEDRYEGQHSLNLNSGWRDPAFIREVLAYHIYERCGARAPKSRVVRLDVNGEFQGVYVEVEQPDAPLLARYQLQGATIFKATGRANQADERDLGTARNYQVNYSQESQKRAGNGALIGFCKALAASEIPPGFWEAHLDVPAYVNYLAATVLTQNWDGYNKNHFVVYDGRGSKRWTVLPWDLDRTLGDHWNGRFDEATLSVLLGTRREPGVTGWNRLQDRFLKDAGNRARLAKRLQELLESEFTARVLFPVIDRLERDLAGDGPADRERWGASRDLSRGIADLKRFIEARRTFLLGELHRLR